MEELPPPIHTVPNATTNQRAYERYLTSKYLRSAEGRENALRMSPEERIVLGKEMLNFLSPNTGYDPHGLGNRGRAKALIRNAKRNAAARNAAVALRGAYDPTQYIPLFGFGTGRGARGQAPLMGMAASPHSPAGGKRSPASGKRSRRNRRTKRRHTKRRK